MAQTQPPDVPASVLARGILILKAFVGSDRPDLSLSDLSARTGLDKSTVLRLANVFVSHEFLSRDLDTKRYRLHTGLLEITSEIRGTEAIVRTAMPHLNELNAATEETCSVHVRVGHQRICVAQVESPHELRMMSALGSPYPLHLGSPGKALMAFLSDEERREIAEEVARGSAVAELLSTLDEVRHRGYAVSRGETVVGAVGIGAPIRGPAGTVVAALNVAGPQGRLDPDSVVEAVLTTAARIAHGLGWRAP